MAVARIYYTESMTAEQFEKALTCRRCAGNGYEKLDTERVCPNCEGDGFSRDNGWTYLVPDDWELQVGDKIVVPPTPKCETEQVVTVIGTDSLFKLTTKLKSAIRRA
jgi:RecJ-like exonuclease